MTPSGRRSFRRRSSSRVSIHSCHRGSVLMGESVSTGVRLRPWLAHERADGADICVKIEPPSRVVLVDPQQQIDRAFECDFVFDSSDPDSDNFVDQEAVYQAIGAPIVTNAIQGHNSCLCAYGQTGTGKTHTVLGNIARPKERGLLPRIASNLFSELDALHQGGAKTKVQASYIEIYNNRLRDLLASATSAASGSTPTAARGSLSLDSGLHINRGRSRALQRSSTARGDSNSPHEQNTRSCSPAPGREEVALKIHTHPTVGVYVENLSEHRVTKFEDVAKLVLTGDRRRQTAATSMNAKSSRSHTIFSFKVEIIGSPDDGNRMATAQVVDLAGRENEQSSECTGDRLRELTFINRSLFQLANCVHALSKSEGEHVPFRNSRLTLLLSESFTHNSRTYLLATLTPSSSAFDDNLLTCRFLESTGRITTWPVPNRFSREELQGQIQEELQDMRKALGLTMPGPPSEIDTQSETDLKAREALHRQLTQADTLSGEARKEAKQAILLDACASAGRKLNAAQGQLNMLDTTNASISESLGKAESCLSSLETKVQQIQQLRDAGSTRQGTKGSVKLPPLVPKASIEVSVEIPPLIEIVLID